MKLLKVVKTMDRPEKARYEFGSYQFDPNNRTLVCAGQPVTLTPKNLRD